jgi:hypothetical protein
VDTGDLIEATRAHRVVEIQYRGPRVVHPHAVYRTSSGALRLEAVQVSGATSSGRLPGWREFDLMKIADVRVLEVEFEPDPDFNRGSERYRHGVLATA